MNLSINTSNFIFSITLIMLSWFFLSTSFFVWGRFLKRLLGLKFSGFKEVVADIWLGFFFCIVFFSIYHLFLPIDAFASAVFYFPGVIYFFIKYGKKLPVFVKSLGFFKLTVVFLTLLLASVVAIQAPTCFDAGLYHLNSIRWNNEHHIIKGIGNLHTRLGFNQTFFLYCSSLNFHPFLNDYAFHVSNSFLYALFFLGMILNGRTIDLVLAALFFFIPMPYHWLTSPTPDMASTLIQIVIFRYFVEAVFYNPKGKERVGYIAFAAILSALLISIKLSNVVYATGLGIVTLLFYKKYEYENCELKQLINAFVFIGVFFVVWITRGYIQSGYPVFPSSIGKIDFEWTIPKALANKMENNVYAGSRSCETTFDINSPILKDYAWLPLWWKRNFYDEEIYTGEDWFENLYIIISLVLFPSTVNNWGTGSLTLLFTSLLLLIIWFVAIVRRFDSFNQCKMLFYLLLVEIASILFWFFMAPCPRFANGIFIILLSTCLLLVKAVSPRLTFSRKLKKVFCFYSLIMFLWNFNLAYSANEFYFNGIRPLDTLPMREFTTYSGLKVFIPQAGVVQCWDSQIPSTIEPNLNLSLIGKSIDEGFCIREKK